MTQLDEPVEARIDDLLVRWQELRQSGREPAVEDLCRDSPELMSDCRERMAALKATDWMFQPGLSSEPLKTEVEPPPPDKLGEYEIIERIGRGGMGTVYKARHQTLDKLVALKVLPEVRLWERHAVARFKREMRAVGRLEHPHLVSAYDAGEVDGTHYLAMQLVNGVDVGQLAARLPELPYATACEIVRQAATGLHSAHEQGMIHRDVKPANLMLGVDGLVRVLDLGLASLNEPEFSDSVDTVSTTGRAMGTIDFMSPEQYDDSTKVDARSDVYSLGATLYKLLSGKSPLGESGSGSRLKKMKALSEGNIASLQAYRPDLPTELIDLVDRMLAVDPAARPSSAQEVAMALEPFVEGNNLRALGLDCTGTISSTADTHRDVGNTRSVRPVPVLPVASQARSNNTIVRMAAGILTIALFVAAAITIYYKTDQGTLVVTAGEGVTIETLQDKGVRLVHARTEQTYDLSIGTHPQRAGEYAILVEQQPSGLKFSTTELIVTRGDATEIRVTLDAPQKVVAANPAAEPRSIEASPTRSGPPALPNNDVESKLDPLSAITIDPPGSATMQFDATVLNGKVHAVRFSPDGSQLFVSGEGDAVVVVDPRTGEEIKRFTGHKTYSRAMAITADGATLYSGDAEGRILEHDIASGELKREIVTGGGSIRDLNLSPEQDRLAAAILRLGIRVFDREGQETAAFDGNYYISPFWTDHGTLFSYGLSSNPTKFDLESGESTPLRENSTAREGTFCLLAERNVAAFVRLDGTVEVFNVLTGDSLRKWDAAGGPHITACFAAAHELLAITTHGSKIQLLNAARGNVQSIVTVPGIITTTALEFSPDGRSLVIGTLSGRVLALSLPESVVD